MNKFEAFAEEAVAEMGGAALEGPSWSAPLTRNGGAAFAERVLGAVAQHCRRSHEQVQQ